MLEEFNTHRPTLVGIAYRMLGRLSDAEDIVQEVWLRWQKQNAVEIQSAKGWLVAATTRLCIDRLRSARREREHYYGVWLPEPLMPETEVDGRRVAELSDSLTVAFMLMLDSLKPIERAVFLLREVFTYEYDAVAAIVGKSEANCRQIARRAKLQLQTRTKPSVPLTDAGRRLVEAFLAATATGKVDDMLALLTDDAVSYSDGGGQVRAVGRPILGADRVSRFLLGIWPRFGPEMRHRVVSLNGGPGLILELRGQAQCAFSFEISAERIHKIYIVCNPQKLRHLGNRASARPDG